MTDDLRALAVEALRAACPSDERCLRDEDECYRAHPVHEAARRDGVIVLIYATPEGAADAVLAAVLPAHRRQVLAEAAESLQPDIDWQRATYGNGADRAATGRLVGMEDAQQAIRRLAAQTPAQPAVVDAEPRSGPGAAAGTQEPAQGDTGGRTVPLAEVLDALRDRRALSAWIQAKFDAGQAESLVYGWESEIDYLADRFGAQDGRDG